MKVLLRVCCMSFLFSLSVLLFASFVLPLHLVAATDDESVDITDRNFEKGDFKAIQGDGELTYENGEATFDVTSYQKNKIVYNKMNEIKSGTVEVDVTSDTDLSRFGFIYRVQDSSTYKYAGTGDTNDQYFSEIFGSVNKWTSMTNGIALDAEQTYRLQVEFINKEVTIFVDGKKIGSWTQPEGTDEAGLIGFEKSRGAANITFSNLTIKEYVEPEAPTTDPIMNNLTSGDMDITIDEIFPRIVNYKVGEKELQGQKDPAYGLYINDRLYYPEVTFEKTDSNRALYNLSVTDVYENLDANLELSLEIKGNQVVYQFETIENNGSAQIESLQFADMDFISVSANDDEARAMLTNLSSDVTKPGDTSIAVNSSMEGIGTSKSYYTGFLSHNTLSAGVWSSSEVNGYGNLIAHRYEDQEGTKTLGIGSNKLYYHREFMPEPSSNTPTIKIVVSEDNNSDDEIDWQDAAIDYRDITPSIKGANNVNNIVGMRIAMNFGSQAQQPFLKTLDNVKKVALATDGLGQAVLLKGYGNEGHDSAHPDYGDIGERIGGAEDLNKLIEEAHQFNTELGVHINAQESYPEADAFSEDLINGAQAKGWGWLDQSYTINKLKDLYSGARAKRLDALKQKAPGLDFIYLDVWYQDQWESDRIAEQIMDRGWRMTTEFGTAVANYSTWQHWATDKNYGGPENKGINSEVLRFISNHQKDSWVLNWPEAGGTADHPLLGGFELAGFEGWQSDKNFDHFIRQTFNTNLPTKFLQKYYVMDWEKTEGDPTKTNLEKEISLEDPNNGDIVVVQRKDNSRERTITLNGNVVLDEHKYLIPWVEQDFESPTPDSNKLYHWNLKGGESTWTLPDEYEGVNSLKVYKLTDQGRTDMREIKVIDNQVTLNAEAETPYILVKEDSEELEINQWSTGNHIHDSGFNTGTIDDDFTNIKGDYESIRVNRTNQEEDANYLSSGDYYLTIDNPTADTSVTRNLRNLQPGKDYVAEVYVENNSDAKAAISISNAKEDVRNSTLRSLQKNYVKADSHASNSGYNSKMQRMQVSFTAESETATLTLSRKAGEGMTRFDDIRIVQKSLDNFVSDNVYKQDFENVVQGIYPFVIGNTQGVSDNRIHLSEKHAPYTQKGWAGDKLVDDVLDGEWSIKVNTGANGLVYRTIPQHFNFEPGATYNVSFDYQTTAGSYRFISGNKEIDVKNIEDAEGVNVNESLTSSTETKNVKYTITGAENGQTYIGIFNDGTNINMHTGAGTFMLDNLRIEKVQPTLKVKNTTINFGVKPDFRSLIITAEDPMGNDLTDKVTIDKGDFSSLETGTYEITYRLNVEGYKELVKTASVTVEAPSIANSKELESLINKYEKNDAFANHGVAQSLRSHVKTVIRFENKDELNKATSHLNQFANLLEIHKSNNKVNEEGYAFLKAGSEALLRKWK